MCTFPSVHRNKKKIFQQKKNIKWKDFDENKMKFRWTNFVLSTFHLNRFVSFNPIFSVVID